LRPSRLNLKLTVAPSTVPSTVPEGVPKMESVPDKFLPDWINEALPPPRGATPYPNGRIVWHDGAADTESTQSPVNVRTGVVGAVVEHAAAPNMNARTIRSRT